MKYRIFGKLDWEVSAISLGVLQLPAVLENHSETNAAAKKAAIRCAIDNGVNFINLGYPYHFQSPFESCSYIREALSEGYREKVKLVVNIPTLQVNSLVDMDRYLDDQLKWFGFDCIDFCQIEWITRASWQKLKDIGLCDWLDSMHKAGKIGHFGFTYHDDSHFLKQIFDYYDWSHVQFDYSLMDYKHHPGVGGLKLAAESGLGVIAAEGLKGGRLTANIPVAVQNIWDAAAEIKAPEEWSLRWLLNHNTLSTAVFEFESPAQVLEYMAHADTCEMDMLDIFELIQANKVRDAYNDARYIPCTACRCCMPCPRLIDAPRIVELYNEALIFASPAIPKFLYELEGHQNALCIKCGACEEACPRHYPLIEIQEKAAALFVG